MTKLTEPDLAVLFAGFHQFVKDQPADKRYDYCSNTDCAFAQYLVSLGYDRSVISVSPFSFTLIEDNDTWTKLPIWIDQAVKGNSINLDNRTRWTFGALDQRLTNRTLSLELL